MPVNPLRGEVWYVGYPQVRVMEPTWGAEIRKKRPCVVVSADMVGVLPLRVVVPLTGWQEAFQGNYWIVHVPATRENGLSKDSGADTLQVRSVDLSRFDSSGSVGTLTEGDLQKVTITLALTLGIPAVP